MKKIWQKGNKVSLNKKVEHWLSADDVIYDEQLAVYDLYGSLGHLHGLLPAKILNTNEYLKLHAGLKKLLRLAKDGYLKVKVSDEDIHTVVENKLFQNIGTLAGKLHTLRSRNDQVLVDLRLYTKVQLFAVSKLAIELTKVFIAFAEKYKNLPMPGYTHMQKAMVSSVGLWAGAFAESLLDDLQVLKAAYDLNNQCPLGSAAGYGAPMPINRQLVAKALGFVKVQNNYLYCQNSRGKVELLVVHSLIQIMQTLNKLASDLMLFTTAEFNFFSLPDSFHTGSSIMPQKRNYDVLELLRSKLSQVTANYQHLVLLTANLPSGYNRDFQEIKRPLFDSFKVSIGAIEIAKVAIGNLKPNSAVLKKSITPDLLVTAEAYKLVKKGMPFREAYQIIGKKYQEGSLKISLGNIKTPSIDLSLSGRQIVEQKKFWQAQEKQFKDCLGKL